MYASVVDQEERRTGRRTISRRISKRNSITSRDSEREGDQPFVMDDIDDAWNFKTAIAHKGLWALGLIMLLGVGPVSTSSEANPF